MCNSNTFQRNTRAFQTQIFLHVGVIPLAGILEFFSTLQFVKIDATFGLPHIETVVSKNHVERLPGQGLGRAVHRSSDSAPMRVWHCSGQDLWLYIGNLMTLQCKVCTLRCFRMTEPVCKSLKV